MATIDFVVAGNRIATESFAIGKIYEIIFTNGNSLICACNHVGNNFVVFQREFPELLFTLNMETASSVRSIEETGGGGGTYNYNELDNKPQINSVELSGNKSSSDLGLQSALDASQLDAVNSGITAAKVTAFEAKQDAITSSNKLSADLVDDAATANKFVTAAEKTAWNAKQNALTASQLDAVNSGITAAKVTAFEGKQDAITSNNKLSADLVNDTTTANKFVTAADKTAWNAKQNALTASQLDAVNSGITAAKVTAFEGKQDAITSNSKLSADLVNDTTTANKFVTATEKAAWNAKQNALTTSQLDAVNSGITAAKVTAFEGKQDAITSNNKLSADLVNDTATTNKFATAAQLSQIETNKNNISSVREQANWNSNSGVKNKLNYTGFNSSDSAGTSPYTTRNVTYKKNADDTVSAYTTNAGANGNAFCFLCDNNGGVNLKQYFDGKHILSCDVYSANHYALFYKIDNETSVAVNGETLLPNRNNITNAYIILQVYNGEIISESTPIVFNPMIRLSSISDSTYQPHAMSNAELTAKEQQNENNISSLDTEIDTVANLGAKNLLDFSKWASNVPVYNGTKSYSNGVMTVTATGSGCVTYHNQYFPEALKIPVKEGEKYIATWDTTVTTNIGFFQLCPNGNAISGTDVSIANKQVEYTVGSGVTYLTYRVGVWASGNSIDISKLMLRPATISDSTYQPYAMSNAELTAAIQALQAQLANQ